MCGIAGAISSNGIDPAVLPRMADAIAHRGPDGEGFLLHRPGNPLEVVASVGRDADSEGAPPTVGFAHRRLSIIDLTHASDQPMVHDSGDLALIYNGEIYNYVELRRELEALGHTFASSGDTEAVLNAYAEWGAACVERFVGMWAFTLLDLRRGEMFCSVDRFGIKPLYYAVAGDTLYFASEIKALMEAPGISPGPDEAIARRYLLTGSMDESERTFFDGVRRITGAHNLVVSLDRPTDRLVQRRYWSVPPQGYDGSRSDAASEFADLFADALRIHVRSDVPVGTCLSGGLDSSAIVCVAEELRRNGAIPHYAHHGFGYVPEDESVSERRYMEEVVRQTSLDMTYVEVPTDRFRAALLGVIAQQDEPFNSASIAAQWFVFDSAKRAGLKVMLDGQGADEVLGGYHSYLTVMGMAMLRKWHLLRYTRFSRQHKRLLGGPPMPFLHAVGQLVPFRVRRAAARSTVRGRLPAAAILSEAMLNGSRLEDYEFPSFESVHDMLTAQISSMGLPALLRYEDRNSMAHSIEARVPFLDHRLVEFAFRLPDDYRIRGVETKTMIRDGLQGVLPEAIRTRKDKIGFRAEPSATWELAESNVESFLGNRNSFEEHWFDRAGLRRLLDRSNRDAATEFTLWRALNTKLWLRTFWGDSDDPLS
jgi:asparagine synthase (glutamine-hydrolysing)